MGIFSKSSGHSSGVERVENGDTSTSPRGDTSTSPRDTAGPSADYDRDAIRDSARRGGSSARRGGSSTGQQSRLPAGTGPGTSGKPASESAMEYDRERSYERNTIAGHGTDSAAAHGGGIADTHRERAQRSPVERQVAPVAVIDIREGNIERDMTRARVNRVLKESHERGHLKPSDPNLMPSDDKEEKTDQLNPVIDETVFPEEHQEIQRIRNIERHIHHIQHHIQPVIANEIVNESRRDVQHPETMVQEFHGNLPADDKLFEAQVHESKNTTTRNPKRYFTLDKGTIVHENVHHHIHHVIQPVIQQKVIDRETVRATIPIREIRHEAPIIHETESHDPVSMEYFKDHNGLLVNALSVDTIGDMLLRRSPCSRTAEGPETDAKNELQVTDRTVTDVAATAGASKRRGSKATSTAQDYGEVRQGTQHSRGVGAEPNAPITIPMT